MAWSGQKYFSLETPVFRKTTTRRSASFLAICHDLDLGVASRPQTSHRLVSELRFEEDRVEGKLSIVHELRSGATAKCFMGDCRRNINFHQTSYRPRRILLAVRFLPFRFFFVFIEKCKKLEREKSWKEGKKIERCFISWILMHSFNSSDPHYMSCQQLSGLCGGSLLMRRMKHQESHDFIQSEIDFCQRFAARFFLCREASRV